MSKLDDARKQYNDLIEILTGLKQFTLNRELIILKDLYEAAIKEEMKDSRYRIAVALIKNAKDKLNEILKNHGKRKEDLEQQYKEYFKIGIPESE